MKTLKAETIMTDEDMLITACVLFKVFYEVNKPHYNESTLIYHFSRHYATFWGELEESDLVIEVLDRLQVFLDQHKDQ